MTPPGGGEPPRGLDSFGDNPLSADPVPSSAVQLRWARRPSTRTSSPSSKLATSSAQAEGDDRDVERLTASGRPMASRMVV